MALTMTPALQQAIRLLQLSSLDLQMEIQQALDSNLMLEAETDEPDWDSVASEPAPEAAADTDGALEEVTASETIPDDMPVDADWQDVFDDYAPSTSGSDDEGLQDYLQANLRSTGTLQEHLASQAQLLPVNERDAEIAANLIDASVLSRSRRYSGSSRTLTRPASVLAIWPNACGFSCCNSTPRRPAMLLRCASSTGTCCCWRAVTKPACVARRGWTWRRCVSGRPWCATCNRIRGVHSRRMSPIT